MSVHTTCQMKTRSWKMLQVVGLFTVQEHTHCSISVFIVVFTTMSFDTICTAACIVTSISQQLDPAHTVKVAECLRRPSWGQRCICPEVCILCHSLAFCLCHSRLACIWHQWLLLHSSADHWSEVRHQLALCFLRPYDSLRIHCAERLQLAQRHMRFLRTGKKVLACKQSTGLLARLWLLA